MRVRLQGDGTPQGTTITDPETGKALDSVESIQLTISARSNSAHAMLMMGYFPVAVDVEASVKVPCECKVAGMCPQGRNPADGPCVIYRNGPWTRED